MQMNRNAPTTSGAAETGNEVANSSLIGSKLLAIAVTLCTAALAAVPTEPVGGGVGAVVVGAGDGAGAGGSTTAGAASLLLPEPPPPQDAVARAKADTKTKRCICFLNSKYLCSDSGQLVLSTPHLVAAASAETRRIGRSK
jgi:hypothetical protein